MPFKVLTKKEAALRARCSPRYLDLRIKAGDLPATRLGRKVVIRSDCLAAWLRRCTTPAQAL